MVSPAPDSGIRSDAGALLNESQKRHLFHTLKYVDELLVEAERLVGLSARTSPFAEHVPDATPLQARVVSDHVRSVRAAMSRALERMGCESPPARISAMWAARTNVGFSQIAVDDLRPRRMRGYGALSDRAALEMDGLVAELGRMLHEIGSYLGQGPGRDLRARMDRLAGSGDSSHLLAEIERIVTARGLVEFRPSLSLLLDRMESQRLEVAVFGRVNSGKSSLLNHVLGEDALPVGVTPVTAVPIRIGYGEKRLARVELASERTMRVVDLAEIAEFASEERNPGNAKRVSAIRIELPNAHLRDGVVLVDTPGFGSLATAGAQETLAYLPRCDAGVVMLDAGSTLTQEELSIVSALVSAGAEVTVLLSKMDVLAVTEQAKVLEHARRNLSLQLGFEIPVSGVSVRGASSRLADTWFRDQFVPLLAARDATLTASLGRKLGSLGEAVAAALEARSAARAPESADRFGGEARRVEDGLRMAAARLEGVRRRADEMVLLLNFAAPGTLKRAAGALTENWFRRSGGAITAGEAVAAELRGAASAVAVGVSDLLSEAAADLSGVLASAARLIPSPGDADLEFSGPRELPVLEVPASLAALEIERPALGFLGAGVCRTLAFRVMRLRALDAADAAFRTYAASLRGWCERTHAALGDEFASRADILRARMAHLLRADPPGSRDDAAALADDAARLRALLGDSGRSPRSVGREPAPVDGGKGVTRSAGPMP